MTRADKSKKPGGQRRSSTWPAFKLGARLRNWFLTGLIIVGPLTITIYIVWWFINVVDAWVKPWVPDRYLPDTYLPFAVPGAGLIFAIFALMLIGALAANLFGRTIISYGENMVGRMPVVRNLYTGSKQIFETVLSQSQHSFKQVGLIEYPRPGIYSIVFISTVTKGELEARWDGDRRLISVFLPTTPVPTSGFLLFVPEDEIVLLDMTIEDAAKMVVSAGLVVPPYPPPGGPTQHQGVGGPNVAGKPDGARPSTTPTPSVPEAGPRPASEGSVRAAE